jgi:hypothetical protein
MSVQVNSWLRTKLPYIDLSEGFGIDQSLSKTNPDVNTWCPFHETQNSHSQSCSVSHKGLYKCHGCGVSGDVFEFYATLHGITRKEAIKKLVRDTPLEVSDVRKGGPSLQQAQSISPSYVLECKRKLRNRVDFQEYLSKERKLSLEVLDKYNIGCDVNRITIPIYDTQDNLVNIRRYLPHATQVSKMVSYGKGFGAVRLYPYRSVKEHDSAEWLIICEGEWDCLTLLDRGFSAITNTGGVSSWTPNLLNVFREKKIVICFDVNDKPDPNHPEGDLGQRMAIKVADILTTQNHCMVKIVVLPLPVEYVGGDVTDYFTKYGGTVDEFKALIDEAPVYTPIETHSIDPLKIPLWRITEATLINKPFEVEGIIVAKSQATYTVPRVISYINTEGELGRMTHTFDVWDGSLASLIKVSETRLYSVIKSKIPDFGGEIMGIKIEEYIVIEEISIAPYINTFTDDHAEYVDYQHVTQRAYYLGTSLSPNRGYTFLGYTMRDPSNGETLLMIVEAIPIESDIDGYEIEADIHDALCKTFQTTEPYQKLTDIAQEHAYHDTHIYGRDDLHICMDLVYHSVLAFSLDGITIPKGWLELLVMGDTRTGKGFVAEGLRKLYGAGEIASGENLTLPGLLGALQQFNNYWALKWGKLPLQDRRLVILDECSSLTQETIASLSRVRSEGIVEITKVVTETTYARTRLIWLGNPRIAKRGTPNMISDFQHGIESIISLIGTMEDIARFDMVLIVARDEVDSRLINKAHETPTVRKYPVHLCRALVRWVWSRTADHVFWEDEAKKQLYQMSLALPEQFTSRIPLIQREDIRYKLARIAVAVAGRTYSTDDGVRLIVKKEHVTCAYNFLSAIYSKACCGYRQLSESELEHERFEYAEQTQKLLAENIKDLDTRIVFIEGLLGNKALAMYDFCEYTGWDIFTAKSIVFQLLKFGALKRQQAFYVKQPAFTQLLQNWHTALKQQQNDRVIDIALNPDLANKLNKPAKIK